MAKSAAPVRGKKEAKASGAGFMIGAIVVTLMAAGGGGILGTMLEQKSAGDAKAVDSKPAKVDDHGKSAEEGAVPPAQGATLKALLPIVTNLRGENAPWVRVEASLVMPPLPMPDSEKLVAQISEDVVAFLRTVSITEIEGASGMQHLREDLDDRVRVRSEGVVQDLIIHTLVIE